jgi:hypothetical protein
VTWTSSQKSLSARVKKQKENNMKISKLQIAIIAAALAGAMSVKATVVDYVSAASGPPLIYVTDSGTLGSQFTVSSSVTVSEAGVWDYLSDGLVDSHEVGVWDSVGTLLDTATVAAGTVDPLMDGFRWAALATSLTLNPGQTYYVGAYYPTAPNNAPNASDYIAAGSQTVNPPFTYVGNAYNGDNGFDANGLRTAGGLQGFFGPDLAVPEPTTMIAGALLLLPFGASTIRILRKNRKA